MHAGSRLGATIWYYYVYRSHQRSLFALIPTRVLLPEPLLAGIRSIICQKYRTTHLKLPPGCGETFCARIATVWTVGRMPSVAIHVLWYSVHRSHDRWYFVSRGFRVAVLLYYWSCPYSLIAEHVSTSYIPHFVRAIYKITNVADPP